MDGVKGKLKSGKDKPEEVSAIGIIIGISGSILVIVFLLSWIFSLSDDKSGILDSINNTRNGITPKGPPIRIPTREIPLSGISMPVQPVKGRR